MMTSHCNDCECCYPKGYAAPSDVPCQCNMRRSPSKLKRTLPQTKIYVTSKSPVGDISVVTLIRTDTTLDHSQKAEKVCSHTGEVPCRNSNLEHNAVLFLLCRVQTQSDDADVNVGRSSQADYLMRNVAMDDSIGGS
mgnify:CR=1 FL=1